MFAARLHVALEFERGVIDPQFAEPCAERLLQLRHPLQIVDRYVRRPTSGSIRYQPVAIMTAPDTITPTDTSASAAMCR